MIRSFRLIWSSNYTARRVPHVAPLHIHKLLVYKYFNALILFSLLGAHAVMCNNDHYLRPRCVYNYTIRCVSRMNMQKGISLLLSGATTAAELRIYLLRV